MYGLQLRSTCAEHSLHCKSGFVSRLESDDSCWVSIAVDIEINFELDAFCNVDKSINFSAVWCSYKNNIVDASSVLSGHAVLVVERYVQRFL